MKKILYYTAIMLLMCISCNETSTSNIAVNKDTTATYDTISENKSIIQYHIEIANSDDLSPELIKLYDSIYKDNPIIIRGAERDLDTIVNHYRFIFRTGKNMLGESD